MIFDLHSHTHFSDGRLSPAELLQRAKERQVSVLAVTDHDTIAGLASAQQAAQAVGIRLVDGVEFSSRWAKVNVHIIGLGIDPSSPELKAAIDHQAQARISRAEAIAERLAKLGIPDTLEGARAIAGDAIVGRPHFAQYLIAVGAVKDMNAAFKKFLGTGKPADVKYEWPEMERVIGWIKAAQGLAVLAHPAKYDLTRTRMCALISDFAQGGGDAIEVINGIQLPGLTQDLAKITQKHDLYASCGSDFHVPNQSWQELGQFGSLPAGLKPVWDAPRFQALLA